MTNERSSQGDGIRLAQLIEEPYFDASYFWPEIPLLLVLGDDAGYAETGIIRPPSFASVTTGLLDLTSEIESCPVSLDALVVPVCSKTAAKNDRPVMLGRSAANDVCLNHKSISKYHAQFIPPRDERGWILRDCGSLNGTWIEGLRVTADDSFSSRGFADIKFGAVHCRFIHPPVLTALVRLLRDAHDERGAADTDPDIPEADLPSYVVEERVRAATETWGKFSAVGDLEEIKKPRQDPLESSSSF